MVNFLTHLNVKKLIGFLIIIVIIGFFYIQMNKNSLTITGNSFETKDLKIQLYSGKIIYQSGKQVANIPKQYGGIDFLLYYKEDLIGQAGIHSTNNWHKHHFTFDFSRTGTLGFDFKADSPDKASLYYKHIDYDATHRMQTEVFYNNSGLTGQTTKIYYNQDKQEIADEIWKNDLLVNMNTYKNGEFLKNYSINKHHQGKRINLNKIDSTGFLVYEYITSTVDTSVIERIVIER